MSFDNFIENKIGELDCIPQVSLKKDSNRYEFSLDAAFGQGRTVFCTLLPGTIVAYFDVDAPRWPETKTVEKNKPIRIDYCLEGRGEVLLEDDAFIYLEANDFCLSDQASKSETSFPSRHYRGVTLFFYPDTLAECGSAVFDAFGLDLDRLLEAYCKDAHRYIGDAPEGVRDACEELWSMIDDPSPFFMKICMLKVVHLIQDAEKRPRKPRVFYTSQQIRIAKKAEELLTADLSSHIPIKHVARQLSVGETSLKNYFRGVFGQNISSYLRDLRMESAARMLESGDESVAEIAARVGYSNQGKFAAVFKQRYLATPLEYRRGKRLDETEH